MDTRGSGFTAGGTLASGEAGSRARKALAIASAAALAICFLPRPIGDILLWPLRMFVTLIHESGHALACIAVGGHVQYLQLQPNGEGVTWGGTADWAKGIFTSGGYLGTALFGAFLLQLARLTNHKITLAAIGAYVLTITLLFAHNPIDNLFTLVTGVALAALFFAAAKYLKAPAAGFLVAFLAVQCCLNAIGDLRLLLYLTTASPRSDNDAVFMARDYPFLPPTAWAIIWGVMALMLLSISLWTYLRATGSKPSKRAISTARS